MYNVVTLAAATSTDQLNALNEVRDFASTDMGRGGHRRWTYRILREPAISEELRRMSSAFRRDSCDGVRLQPSPLHEFRSQDRALTESWPTPGGAWTFNGVFDGHAGHTVVDHAVVSIPTMVRRSLEEHLRARRGAFISDAISKILSDAIVTFDSALQSEFVTLFPGGVDGLQRMSDSQIRRVFQNPTAVLKAIRCMHGSTALLSLTDPSQENLWICNLGDCQAVLSTRDASGRWRPSFISTLHDGDNTTELQRIRREHPGEHDVTRDNRVIGFLGPTRSLGDIWLKIPAAYSQRVLSTFRSEWIVDRPEMFTARVRTPPYVHNAPDVRHLHLPRPPAGRRRPTHALLLCSDGLPDLYNARYATRAEMAAHWMRVVGAAIDAQDANAALVLLRDALGGEDVRAVSQYLTVEMEERWMDDVTILVQRI